MKSRVEGKRTNKIIQEIERQVYGSPSEISKLSCSDKAYAKGTSELNAGEERKITSSDFDIASLELI